MKDINKVLAILSIVGGFILFFVYLTEQSLPMAFAYLIAGFIEFVIFYSLYLILDKLDNYGNNMEKVKYDTTKTTSIIERITNSLNKNTANSSQHSWKCNNCGETISVSPCPYCNDGATKQ